jgi:probable rRNA maturation factor
MSASPRRRLAVTPSIDIMRESPLWQEQAGIEATLQRSVAEAAAAVSATSGELAIVLTDDARIRDLNRAWRGIDKPTNVLSFPTPGIGAEGNLVLLGDIVIAYETAAREAAAENKPFLHHLAHLAVHGFLHLRGHDHEADDEAMTMERLERAVLARMGIPDPYAARDAALD